jgi:hypothetical protein
LPDVVIAVTDAGSPLLPSEGTTTDATFEGRVVPSSDGAIHVDTCDPAADCAPHVVSVQVVEASMPSNVVPPGALVRLRYFADVAPSPVASSGPLQHVAVQNLATWGSLVNPVSNGQRVWLQAETVAGGVHTVPADASPLAVSTGVACAPDIAAEYGLQLVVPGNGPFGILEGTRGELDATGPYAAHYVVQSIGDSEQDSGSFGSYWIVGQ